MSGSGLRTASRVILRVGALSLCEICVLPRYRHGVCLTVLDATEPVHVAVAVALAGVVVIVVAGSVSLVVVVPHPVVVGVVDLSPILCCLAYSFMAHRYARYMSGVGVVFCGETRCETSKSCVWHDV
jgi:hypothetical protein